MPGPGAHLGFEVVQEEIHDRLRDAERNRLFRGVVQKVRETAVIKTVFGDEWKFEPPPLDGPRPE